MSWRIIGTLLEHNIIAVKSEHRERANQFNTEMSNGTNQYRVLVDGDWTCKCEPWAWIGEADWVLTHVAENIASDLSDIGAEVLTDAERAYQHKGYRKGKLP